VQSKVTNNSLLKMDNLSCLQLSLF